MKSTGGRPGTSRPSEAQPSTSNRNESTRTQTNAPMPGPSSVRPDDASSPGSPVDPSSSEMLPEYGDSGASSPVSNATFASPPASPHPSLEVQSPNSPPRSPLQGPTAPMPKNRPIRDEAARNVSPRKPDESISAHRKRLQEAHRRYNRGGAG